MANDTPNNQPPESNNDKFTEATKGSDQANQTKLTETNSIKNQDRITNMEIHRHPNPHEKKSFKSYIFEFFMLFLAVTAGFFIENLREHHIEKSREEQYIMSLIRDLAVDTLSMSAIIESTKKQANGIDTLLTILEKPKSSFFVDDVYYYSFRYMFNATFFSHTDGTITQLKNAGGLRLIRQGVSDSIIEYYSLADNVKWNTDFGLAQFNKVMELEKSLFDFKTLRINRFSQLLTQHQKSTLSFMTSEPLVLNRFYAETFFFLSQLNSCNRLLIQLKPRARILIEFLKRTYNLE